VSRPSSTSVALAPPSVIEADVLIEDDRWGDHPDVEAAIGAAIGVLAADLSVPLPQRAAVTVVLADDAAVAALNIKFRQKAGATNVLSFPAGAGVAEPGAAAYLGDVILARQTVVREAEEMSVPFRHHLQHLALHGVLHLVGFDHVGSAAAEAMEALEVRLLARLGVADPYAPEDDACPMGAKLPLVRNRQMTS
jgi:probable rRNA maturation factor